MEISFQLASDRYIFTAMQQLKRKGAKDPSATPCLAKATQALQRGVITTDHTP
jgi:hypothetical protein